MPQNFKNLSEMKNDQNLSYVEEFRHEEGACIHACIEYIMVLGTRQLSR